MHKVTATITGGFQEPLNESESAEFLAQWQKDDAERAATEYQRLRAAAYPDLGEQFDLLFHSGVLKGTDWYNIIEAVKRSYPKP